MSNSIKILMTGDFVPLMNNPELDNDQLVEYIYDEKLLMEINEADLSITNLEIPQTTASTPVKKSGPNLCAPSQNIRYIK